MMSKNKKELEELLFVVFGGEVEQNGKPQHYPGLIDHNKNNIQMIAAMNQAIITLARLSGITPEDFDKETANQPANDSFLELLRQAGQARYQEIHPQPDTAPEVTESPVEVVTPEEPVSEPIEPSQA